MFGGVLTVCPACSNQWTLSPAVSVSWFCPKCGGARDTEASSAPCQCGHPYSEHHTSQQVPPSRAAFGISLNETDKLDEILAAEPVVQQIGECHRCACRCFHLNPPHLSPKLFLQHVGRQANRSVRSRNVVVTDLDGSTLSLTRGSRSICLRIESDERVVLDPSTRAQRKQAFTMGRATVGQCVIAIMRALGCSQ